MCSILCIPAAFSAIQVLCQICNCCAVRARCRLCHTSAMPDMLLLSYVPLLPMCHCSHLCLCTRALRCAGLLALRSAKALPVCSLCQTWRAGLYSILCMQLPLPYVPLQPCACLCLLCHTNAVPSLPLLPCVPLQASVPLQPCVALCRPGASLSAKTRPAL